MRCKFWVVIALLSGTAYARTDVSVSFDYFEYTGRDAVFEQSLPSGSYRNPILAGFYPDPSVTRAGDKFYLVNSSFAYFPGIPVFESRDLAHWTQVGHVIDRASELSFDGLGISRGVFAATIQYHDGTYYVLNTAVDSGGNFIVTAKSPQGPWSDPIWLPQIDGIDPSLFIDDDGEAYIVNNGPPEDVPQYPGHRAIWIQQFNLEKMKLFGPRRVLVNGGVDFSKKPVWIEGPHVFKHDGFYYLSCAEGGTEVNHSQVILRAHSPWGPFTPYEHNPILTQRDLPADRANPVTNTGHADLVEAPDGSWWAVFLGSRPYEGKYYNTGRETFLLPVTWKDGWPTILEQGAAVPYVAKGPAFMQSGDQAPLSGNFKWRDEFDAPVVNPLWLQVRVPKHAWFDFTSKKSALTIHPLDMPLDGLGNPSYLGRRQQHQNFEATTQLTLPKRGTVDAGIAVFQSEKYWYFCGARRKDKRTVELFLEKKAGDKVQVIAQQTVPWSATIKLRVSADQRWYSFYFDAGQGWKALDEKDDGSTLSTQVAGGFVGTTLGPYARVPA
ncbi:MAG TPA: glycoside hydrolase family 43 protein, partial [Steroidobacteraceae bacterium]|nr:glycoside hydrolase family 43 protein [Steroidobacteraceae bacterium]